MSQKERITSDISWGDPLSIDRLQGRLGGHLYYTQEMLTGKLLTLIDTLGFDEKREKAIKDSVKQIIRSTLSQEGRNLDSIITDLSRVGLLHNEHGSASLSSLENYQGFKVL